MIVTQIHVIPLKNGLWRPVEMTRERARWWYRAWRQWFDNKGKRLAISPEMWQGQKIRQFRLRFE
jgi:hypothetical protein